MKFSFQATPTPPQPSPTPCPNISVFSLMHHSWFCSLMHSLSLSQPHYQIFIISFYLVFQALLFSPPLVMSCRGFSCCCCCCCCRFLPLSISIHAAKPSISHFVPALSALSFILPPSYLPLIPFSITFPFPFHFFLIQPTLAISSPPPHLSLP